MGYAGRYFVMTIEKISTALDHIYGLMRKKLDELTRGPIFLDLFSYSMYHNLLRKPIISGSASPKSIYWVFTCVDRLKKDHFRRSKKKAGLETLFGDEGLSGSTTNFKKKNTSAYQKF